MGWSVRVRELRTDGQPGDRSRGRSDRRRARIASLRFSSRPRRRSHALSIHPPIRPIRPSADDVVSEIKLLGLRVDEAEAELTQALDAAVLADLPYLRIIHGKGTGALRELVHRVLAADPRVARFALAPANQGGCRRDGGRVSGVSLIPDDLIEQIREAADLVGIIGESVELKRTRLGLSGTVPVSRRHPPQLRRDPQEGDVPLLRVPRVGRRLHLLHEAAGHGLPDGRARGGPPDRDHDSRARTIGPRSARAAVLRPSRRRTTGSRGRCTRTRKGRWRVPT